ncbi:MAG TPA: hypothetical protein VEZ11_00815 [Thermoanaerobaculia bacterium]|nr:hypothetical protein [Thermoanaerobaculia bacterium]
MSPAPDDLLATRRGGIAAGLGITALFLALRIPLLRGREPFFDELFTRWLAAQPFGAILRALRLDSGPPLYYFLAHIIFAVHDSIIAARVLSLTCVLGTLVLILAAQSLGRIRYLAAALLAVYPPFVLFSVDARSYALCALFIAIAVVALERWSADAEPVPGRPLNPWLLAATGALVAAAYSHYYGALFLPLPAALGLIESPAGRRRVAGIAATLVAGVLFLPGIALALRQPPQATAWFGEQETSPFAALAALGFAADYPRALFAPAPALLVAFALVLLIASIARTASSPRAIRFAVMTLTPVAVAMAMQLTVRQVWFPMRFEAVIAPPLAIWIAAALDGWRRPLRIAIAGGILLTGLGASWNGIIDHYRRPLDPYRQIAIEARRTLDPRSPIVASGYLWLEVVSQRDASWHPPVIAFPAEQAAHPGWRPAPSLDALLRERTALPSPPFVWIGELNTNEMKAILTGRSGTALFANGRAGAMLVK